MIIIIIIIIIIITFIIIIIYIIINVNKFNICSLGMILSDMSVPGCPIVHLNTGFTNMTGYGNEKLGTNCKFLQVRTDRVQSPSLFS